MESKMDLETIMNRILTLRQGRQCPLRSFLSQCWVACSVVGALGVAAFSPGARAATTQDDIQQLVKKGAPIIDVRTPGEFKGGHLKGAINLPVNEVAERISSVTTNKSAPILVHCQSGGRSATAKKKLEAIGYNHVFDLGSLKRAHELTGK
jgi:phage shock protein E